MVGGGVEIEEVINLMDELKADLRKELATKQDLDSFETRVADLEEDIDQMHLSQDIDQKKLRELQERADLQQIQLTT